jgi:glucoamylase
MLAVAGLAAALALSGGSATDPPVPHGLPGVRPLFLRGGAASRADGGARAGTIRSERSWLARGEPLGTAAPAWAKRMHARSLLVLRALTDMRRGAAVAGAREGWAYVWPRDAAAVAIAFARAGYRAEAGRIAHFLSKLDVDAAARFYASGEPVPGRDAQGDASGWVAAACAAAAPADALRRSVEPRAGTHAPSRCESGRTIRASGWAGRGDYQEKESGDYLANAIASGLGAPGIRKAFAADDALARETADPGSGLDTAAAWAVRPFPRPELRPLVRRTLLRLAAESGRFGLLPSQDWDGGEDPWTAPTAWTAWSLAALAREDRRAGAFAVAGRERRAALRVSAALRRAATPLGLLPERVDVETGAPRSTTPLAWSHAFAILALRELFPGRAAP